MNWQHIFFFKGKKLHTKNMELQLDIVKTFHDHKTAGHPEEIGADNAVWQHYWWPRLQTFVKTMCRGGELAKNLESTGHQQNHLTFQLKGSIYKAICKLFNELSYWSSSSRGMCDSGCGRSRSFKGVILVFSIRTLTSEETARLLLENLYRMGTRTFILKQWWHIGTIQTLT